MTWLPSIVRAHADNGHELRLGAMLGKRRFIFAGSALLVVCSFFLGAAWTMPSMSPSPTMIAAFDSGSGAASGTGTGAVAETSASSASGAPQSAGLPDAAVEASGIGGRALRGSGNGNGNGGNSGASEAQGKAKGQAMAEQRHERGPGDYLAAKELGLEGSVSYRMRKRRRILANRRRGAFGDRQKKRNLKKRAKDDGDS